MQWHCMKGLRSFFPYFYLIYILQRSPALIGYTDLFLTFIAFKSRHLLCHLETLVILETESITGDYSRWGGQENQGRSGHFTIIS